MAIKALDWLSENLGIDITGKKDEESEGLFSKIGKPFFGENAEEESGLPDESWGYEYNAATGQWEPTRNAPSHIFQEQQERLQELTSPPKEVAPPPMVVPAANFNQSRDMKRPEYADHFNSYTNGSPTSMNTSPQNNPASPTFSSNCINATPPTPEFPGAGPEVIQEQATAMLHFAAPPLPQMQAMELPVTSMVQLSAPPPPPPMPMMHGFSSGDALAPLPPPPPPFHGGLQ